MSQTPDDLQKRVDETNAIFSKLLEKWDRLSPITRDQLTTGINKAYGQAASFQHEYKIARAAEKKLREVVTQVHADVTVGQADSLFAKSIEAKSVTAPTKGDANTLIRKALEQLAGMTGFTPRDNDVRVLDLKITDQNPWPNAGGGYGLSRDVIPLEDILRLAKEELWSLIDDPTRPGAQSLLTWLSGETYSSPLLQSRLRQVQSASKLLGTNPHSSRMLVKDIHGHAGHLRCLTIKIRYASPYLTHKQSQPLNVIFLDEMVFQVHRGMSKSVGINLAKTKYRISDEVDADVFRDFSSSHT
ncbi:hypothetical protein EJO68_33315 [Variovorax atrisoli]|uniref:hypothetical protein n=1 Tax=Variovorax atrisoli TaxID=3394203 RepID=UPI000F7E395F|nr:hypothetical protein [Variovorax sp. 369]RTD84018.1 hypothetical protein EJO68_33315 [Variovorax sp. 369]